MEEPRPTDIPEASGAPETESPAAAQALPVSARPSFKRRHWGKLTLLAVLGVPAIVLSLWTVSSLSWSYSSGERAGFVQKISRKGWVCKTWEGVLYTSFAKGFGSDSFQFSVRSDSLAHVIEGLSGKQVAVHYEQHIGVPTSCFGDTEYFVTTVRKLDQ